MSISQSTEGGSRNLQTTGRLSFSSRMAQTDQDPLAITILIFKKSSHLHMGTYFGGAMVPHSLHFLRFSSAIHAWMYGLSWYPKFSTWKASSRMIVGSVCAGFRQYQRRRSENHGKHGA